MNDQTPLVSVIVPTYNRKLLLNETIQSILNQTYQNFELIIVDNFSNYDFYENIKKINDYRIHTYQNQNNGIIAVNRNYGIKKSNGKYIALCDDDDIWNVTKLEKQIRLMIKTDAEFCFSGYSLTNFETGISIIKDKLKFYQKKISLSTFLFSLGFICNSSIVFKKNIISDIGLINEDLKLTTVEDYEFITRFLKRSNAVYIDESLVNYRVHTNAANNTSNIIRLRKQMHLHRLLMKNNKDYWFIIFLKYIKIFLYFLLKQVRLISYRFFYVK